MKNALIALGGNIGDVKSYFDSTYIMLQQHCHMVATSKLYQTPAMLAANAEPQPDYLNAAISLETHLTAAALLAFLHDIEAKHARKRIAHWGARTLDLDLLAYENTICADTTLTLPHPHLHQRMFVLQPLADIQPAWVHPVLQKDVLSMIEALPDANNSRVEGIVWTKKKK